MKECKRVFKGAFPVRHALPVPKSTVPRRRGV